MALVKNPYGGIDLLATVTEFDKRITALEVPAVPVDPPPAPEVSKSEWTPAPPSK